MYFQIVLFCCVGFLLQRGIGKNRMADGNMTGHSLEDRQACAAWARRHAAVCAGIPVLLVLFTGRMFSVTELLCICAAAGGIVCIRWFLQLMRPAGPAVGICLKMALILLVFYAAVFYYKPEQGSGDISRDMLYVQLFLWSALLVFSRRAREYLEGHGGHAWFAVLTCITPVWGFYMIERVRNGVLGTMGWLYVTGNIFLLALLHACLYCVLPYKKLAIGSFLTACFVFGLANYYVSLFKGNPVMPNDLLSLNTAFQVAGGYEFQMTGQAAAGLLHWYASVGILCSLPAGKTAAGWKWKAAVGSLAVVLCINAVICLDAEKYQLGAIDQWTVNNFYNTKGSVLGFAGLVKKLKIEEPEGYSIQRAQQLLENSMDAGNVRKDWAPAVIAVMDESFSDLRSLGDFSCSQEYLKEWNAMDDYACRGTLYVSTYGGGTANSEFEFLTGNSIANCASGTIPYQIYDLKNTGNLAGILTNDGYQATAVHPQYKGNWNRMRTYANFGFDDFLGSGDFESPRYIRSHISDESSFDKVIELYEQNGGRQFIFNVTMQNHGGYLIEDMAGMDCIQLKKEWEAYTDVQTYLTLMRESDQAVRKLLDYFRNIDEPVIVCIFGDHHPAVSADWIAEVMGKPAEGLSLEDVQKKYAVPYLIWANFETPYEQCSVNLSANYLGALLLENAGLRQSAYTGFLQKMREEIPAVNALGYQTKDGAWHALDEEDESGWMADYRIVQYYAMFEEKREMKYFE